MELLQGLRISVVSSRFGFAFRTHGGHSKSCHVVADVCRFAGRVGDIHIVVEDAHGKSKLCQFTVVHDDIRLEAAVLCAIQQQVYLAVDFSKTIEQINKAPLVKSQSKKLHDAIEQKEREFAKIVRYKQAIYQDWKDGEITHQDYRHMKEEYEQQAETLNQVLERLREEQRELENGIDTENPFLATFRQYQNIEKLTRDVLIELVDHIKVYEGGSISIVFRFADELRRIREFIELNTHSEAV